MGRSLHNCTLTSSLVPRPRGRRESMRPGNEANPQAANLGPLCAIMEANIIFYSSRTRPMGSIWLVQKRERKRYGQ